MKIVILCNEDFSAYLKSLSTSIGWITTNHINEWNDITDADGYFNLNENAWNENYSHLKKPNHQIY
jgi:hypothetical protein